MPSFLISCQRRCIVSISAVALALASGMTAGAAGVHVFFPEQVQVRQAVVSLGDIVDISGDALPVVLRLRQLSLGQAPHVGTPVQVSRSDVARWIHTRLGALADPLIWHGAQATVVTAQSAKADVSALTQVAQGALQTWLSAWLSRLPQPTQPRIIVTAQAVTRELVLPAGHYTYLARPMAEGAMPQKMMDVWIEVHRDGQFLQVVPVRFAIAIWHQAWVAQQEINPGNRLLADACERKEVDLMSVARPQELRLASDQLPLDPGGMRAKHRLRAGDMLSLANTERYPTIVRGEIAALRTVAGAVQLERRGQAMEDGMLGQLVHFMSVGTTTRLVARISSPGVADIE